MAKRRKKKTNPALPKWAVTVFAVIAVVLSIFTFGGDLIGIDTSFAQQAMDFIDRILYGGPTGPTPSLPVSGQVKVYIIDVGQGESILVTTDQSSLLIDAGENDKGWVWKNWTMSSPPIPMPTTSAAWTRCCKTSRSPTESSSAICRTS